MVTIEPKAAQLLDAIYLALQNSDFAQLEGLGSSLLREIDHPETPFGEAGLQLIRRRAERNARCLQAVQRGIKAAQRRLADIRHASGGLMTYDRSGKRAVVTPSRVLAQRL